MVVIEGSGLGSSVEWCHEKKVDEKQSVRHSHIFCAGREYLLTGPMLFGTPARKRGRGGDKERENERTSSVAHIQARAHTHGDSSST